MRKVAVDLQYSSKPSEWRLVDQPAHGSSTEEERIKRFLDVAGALFGLVFTAPLLAICAVMIKLSDGGPVLYTQWRAGRGGWLFRIYKLRTMYLDSERRTGAVFARRSDDRIIPLCRWMRRSHADELPQLINVIRGEMSLVGPRPERPEIMDQLAEDVPGLERRLAVKPGVTGLAQLRNGYTNDVESARRKLALDLAYIERMGWLTDLRLILGTVPRLWDRTAC